MRIYKKVDGKLSPEDIEEEVSAIVANNKLESIVLTEEEIDMLRKYISGDITSDEYETWIKNKVGVTV